MKKLFIAIALLSVLGTASLCCGCGKNGTDTQPKQAVSEAYSPSIHWRVDTTGKYLNDANVKQIVTVQCDDKCGARVKMFEKTTVGEKNIWTETLSCDGIIGLEGLGKTKEGDNKTPIGDFGILTAFGIKPNPGTKLPYVDVTPDTYCCGDEEYYNKIINAAELSHECPNGEHLIDYTPEYNYGLFIDYNKECEPGKGSAIFFHCAGANTYTGGCVAVSEENMVKIMNTLEPGARIIIDYIPGL